MTIAIEENPALGKTASVLDIETNFLETGEGEPVVLLHGSGVGVSAWANWHKAIPALGKHFRVVAPDMPGFGYTERKPGQKYDMKFWVAHLLGFLDVLGIEQANLVGNSFGGGLSLAFTLRHPERVRRLVLMGTPAGHFPMTHGLKGPRSFEPTREWVAEMMRIFPHDPAVVTEEMIDERYQAMQRPDERAAFKKLMPKDEGDEKERIVRGVPEDRLATIDKPTLVIHGREDRVIPLEIGLRMLTNMARAEMHVFGQCGHWVQLERPDAFHALVAEFLQRQMGMGAAA